MRVVVVVFSVGTGDRQQGAGADLKEDFHFTGDLGAPLPQCRQGRGVGVHSGGPEHQVGGQIIQVAVADTQLGTLDFQVQHLSVQLFPGGPVAANDAAAVFQQQPHQGPIADPQPQHHDGTMPPGGDFFFQQLVHGPFLVSA